MVLGFARLGFRVSSFTYPFFNLGLMSLFIIPESERDNYRKGLAHIDQEKPVTNGTAHSNNESGNATMKQ